MKPDIKKNPGAEQEILNADPQFIYNERYYEENCGPLPYDRSCPHWSIFFGKVADWIVESIKPHTVLDAGCAKGFLVEFLRDRGIEAFGLDISKYALSQVRDDIKQFCFFGSIVEALSSEYDLITCIEVLEHLNENDGYKAIKNICQKTHCILFSSSPVDFQENTHINVKPVIYWLKIFAEHGFYPDLSLDVGFIAPQAMILRKKIPDPDKDILPFYASSISAKFSVINLLQALDVERVKAREAVSQLQIIRSSVSCRIVDRLRRIKLIMAVYRFVRPTIKYCYNKLQKLAKK
jgi:SAM-dependent methyltransferase